MSQARHQTVQVPGGSIYYRTCGTGPALLLMGGGPANADTLSSFASCLAQDYSVVSYDRRGYSRSYAADPADRAHPADPGVITRHADDARRLIADLGPDPVTVFGTSFGALIALELAAFAPDAISTLIVHEPPLGQLLAGGQRQPFDLNLDFEKDAASALDAIAASVGVTRGRAANGPASRPGTRPADIELFIRRDVPAVGRYHLDLDRLHPLSGRIIVTASQDSHGFYPYQCAQQLARQLSTALTELPGHHAGMIQHPDQFAAQLRHLLRRPAASGARDAAPAEEVTT
jgi:pimeloyl-ACP methyl ester carboxylesterase